MSDLARSIRAAREAFTDELLAEGFKQQADDSYYGDIDIDGEPVEHVVTIPDDFPIDKPKVHTTDGAGGNSWHRERTGHFCLWTDDEASHLPWASAAGVIARVQEWHRRNADGWTGDSPDLDLERYWPRTGDLILHPDLDGLDGSWLRLHPTSNGAWRVRFGPFAKRRHTVPGVVVDAGELSTPIHTIDELLDTLDPDVAAATSKRLDGGTLHCVLVRYTRQGHPGVLGLVRTDAHASFKACVTAHTGDATVRLRAGLDAPTLVERSVAIIGLGAVGSHIADLLARSGIGGLTLVDAGVLRPGNCIRHLAGHEHVGLFKVEAVRRVLTGSRLLDDDSIKTLTDHVTGATQIEALAQDHDLLIDATGNGPATTLVLLAARTLNQPAITACLQHDGRVLRIDRAPLGTGEAHAGPLPPDPHPHVGAREGGCGDPVSPSPPWGVATVAGVAVAVAVDALTGRNQYPPTVIQVLVTSPHLAKPLGTG